MLVASVPSRRENSAWSSSKTTEPCSAPRDAGCALADQTNPLSASRRKTNEPQSSRVAASRQRVTAMSRQRLEPAPDAVSITA